MSIVSAHQQLRRAFVSVILLAGCDKAATESEADALQLTHFAGDHQVAEAGSTLVSPLAVHVADAAGRSVRDARIRWAIEGSGGLLGAVTTPSVTDATGVARIFRTLGPDAGVQTTLAAIDGGQGPPIRFTSIATIQGAVRMEPNPSQHGNLQADTVLATLAEPYSVRVIDHNDAPVPGVTVEWIARAGSVSAATSTTDANGVARVTHTLGAKTGSQYVDAMVPRLVGSPLRFEATAEPGNPTTITEVAGSGQIGTVGTPILPYVVEVTDAHGNGVADVAIEWAVLSGAGSLDGQQNATSPAEPGTPGRGAIATAVHRLGAAEGSHTVAATAVGIPGSPQLTFTATAVTALVHLDAANYYGCFYYGMCSGAFEPSEVTIPAGSTVGWIWGSSGSCDLVFEDDPTPPTSAPVQHAGSHLRTFDEPGLYRYRCTLYSAGFTEGMVGTVTVQ